MIGFDYRRWVPVALVMAASLALPLIAKQAAMAQQTLREAEVRHAMARGEAAELVGVDSKLDAFREYQEAVAGALDRANEQGLSPGDWVAGKVDIRQRDLSRREAAGFLSGAGRLPGYYFIPETFDLYTTRNGDDLFHFKRGDVDLVRLTLKGAYFSQGRQ